jgi:hypothetical protein
MAKVGNFFDIDKCLNIEQNRANWLNKLRIIRWISAAFFFAKKYRTLSNRPVAEG